MATQQQKKARKRPAGEPDPNGPQKKSKQAQAPAPPPPPAPVGGGRKREGGEPINKGSTSFNLGLIITEFFICSENNRPVRANAGKGGALEQMEKIGEQVRHKPKSKSKTADIPMDADFNPMAPTEKAKRQKRVIKGVSVLSPAYPLSN
jgi:hypothetical protein